MRVVQFSEPIPVGSVPERIGSEWIPARFRWSICACADCEDQTDQNTRAEGVQGTLTESWAGGRRHPGGIIAMSLATSAHVSPIFPWKGAITESSMVGTVTGWLFQEPASSESTDGSEPDASEDGGEASTFRTDP